MNDMQNNQVTYYSLKDRFKKKSSNKNVNHYRSPINIITPNSVFI